MKTETVSHTPGPWLIRYPDHKDAEFIQVRSESVKLIAGRSLSIAKVQYQKAWKDPYISNAGRKESEIQITKEQAEANALLIAAAPELLAFAKSVVNHFEVVSNTVERKFEPWESDMWQTAEDVIRKVEI